MAQTLAVTQVRSRSQACSAQKRVRASNSRRASGLRLKVLNQEETVMMKDCREARWNQIGIDGWNRRMESMNGIVCGGSVERA